MYKIIKIAILLMVMLLLQTACLYSWGKEPIKDISFITVDDEIGLNVILNRSLIIHTFVIYYQNEYFMFYAMSSGSHVDYLNYSAPLLSGNPNKQNVLYTGREYILDTFFLPIRVMRAYNIIFVDESGVDGLAVVPGGNYEVQWRRRRTVVEP